MYARHRQIYMYMKDQVRYEETQERVQPKNTMQVIFFKKRSREISPEILDQNFETLQCVPPYNIMNYDKTNLSDDPDRKRVIMKRNTTVWDIHG